MPTSKTAVCKATAKNGQPCRGRALVSGFCFAHDPELRAKQRPKRYAPYEGGDWSIDESALHEHRLSDQPTRAELRARHKLITSHYLPHAQRRILEGNRMYTGIAAEYRRELAALVDLLGSVHKQPATRRATARVLATV